MCQPYLVSLHSGVTGGREGSGGTNQMAADVIARMTLLTAGKSERALFVITLPGSNSLLWREEGLAPSSIRSDKGKCVKGDGFQSGEEKEAHLIFRWGLSICPRMKMSFRRMETYVHMPGDELRKSFFTFRLFSPALRRSIFVPSI